MENLTVRVKANKDGNYKTVDFVAEMESDYMTYQLNRPDFDTIINHCNDLLSNEKLEVFEFGKECDLVLHIYKDEDMNHDVNKECCHIVRIHTAQNGEWVDDTEDTYVTDGSLYRELERIYNYQEFGTL